MSARVAGTPKAEFPTLAGLLDPAHPILGTAFPHYAKQLIAITDPSWSFYPCIARHVAYT
jgi:hypothetical protein